MLTNLMVDENFICFAATSNILAVHCETHEVLLIRMAPECTHLGRDARNNEIRDSNLDEFQLYKSISKGKREDRIKCWKRSTEFGLQISQQMLV